jgi:hypothetical protein
MIDESGPEKIPNLFLNFLSGALNSFSSRPVSFIALVKGEKSINPFFRLLDSLDKSVEML